MPTISVYASVLKNYSLPVEEFFEYCNGLCPEIFLPILEAYQGKDVAKIALLYIMHAYSIDSEAVLLESNWAKNKKAIADKVQLPDHMWNDLVMLKSKPVQQVIRDYLSFQQDDDWKHLQMNRDVYELTIDAIYVGKGEGVDFSDIISKRKLAGELRDEITQLQEAFKDKYRFVYENLGEIAKVVANDKGGSNSLNIEDNKYTQTNKPVK